MGILQKIRTINTLSPKLEREKALFLKRLGSLLKEGYSIKKSLEFMAKFEKKESKLWAASLQKGLEQGHALHEELEKIGYSSKVCSQIYLSSQHGSQAQIVFECGEDLINQEKLKKKFLSLLAYPVVLIVFLFMMLLLMRFLVLPNMQNMFGSNLSNPNIYANFLVSFIYYSPQIILMTISLIIILYFYLVKKLARFTPLTKIEYFSKWPFVKKYLTNYWTSFIFLEWGQLLRKGISFHEIIAMMSDEEASTVLKETGQLLADEMLQGKTVKEGLETLPFFEDEALAVISHGENLGQLGTEMLIYASYCEDTLTEILEKALTKLQPIIFIFIALMIIAIYASMILPIYTLMEAI